MYLNCACGSAAVWPAQVLESRVDHTRVVHLLRKADNLPLVKDYLLSVQKSNLAAVNEAVNELLVEEDNFEVPPFPAAAAALHLHDLAGVPITPATNNTPARSSDDTMQTPEHIHNAADSAAVVTNRRCGRA